MPEESPKPKYPGILLLVALVAFFGSLKYGIVAFFCIGFPIFCIALWIGGGGRKITKVPNRDALIYIGVGIALVLGIILYVRLTV